MSETFQGTLATIEAAIPFILLAGLFAVIVVVIVLSPHRSERSQPEGWKEFAAAQGLSVVPDDFPAGKARLVGTYRGHDLKIESLQERDVAYYTLVRLGANRPDSETSGDVVGVLPDAPTPHDVLAFLIPHGLDGVPGGEIETTAGGQLFSYKPGGPLADGDKLGCVCDALAGLADGYPALVALGGTVAPALQALARENILLCNVAVQALKDIAQATQYLAGQADRLLCPRCLVRCSAHCAGLPGERDVTYYGCRACCQSREFIPCPREMVAVLDAGWSGAQDERNGCLRVNWLARRALFDFDRVEIVRATDKDVEHFAIQVGNDTDPIRKPRYAQMRCSLAPNCHPVENTLRILESLFGQVDA
jgi:hypothetical protein